MAEGVVLMRSNSLKVRLGVAALAVVTTVGLVACGGSNTRDSDSNDTKGSETRTENQNQNQNNQKQNQNQNDQNQK